MKVREEPKNGIDTMGAANSINIEPNMIIYKKSPVCPANVSSSNLREYLAKKNIWKNKSRPNVEPKKKKFVNNRQN